MLCKWLIYLRHDLIGWRRATAAVLVTWLLQYLWNITMPQVFNLKEVTYWEAFRILLIAAILFGGPNIALG